MFRRGQKQYRWGAGIFLTAFAMNGYSVFLSEGFESGNDTFDAFVFAIAYCYGIPGLICGPIMFFSGRHKLKDLTQDYNYYNQKKGDVSISFGPQQYGYGLALTF